MLISSLWSLLEYRTIEFLTLSADKSRLIEGEFYSIAGYFMHEIRISNGLEIVTSCMVIFHLSQIFISGHC